MITKGQKINDRYEIIRTIGEGGMANVYLAEDLILKRRVAVKILRGDLASDEKFVRRFQREANSASRLSHPNIVEMYDVGEDGGKYFIVMEYIEGRTLKSLIKKRGGLTLPEVIDIMLQLTSGIACAHESYIIHRDIKPQNVLILDDGRVKITDFGIAQALNSNELTQTNSVMGSVHYLPPEQANGTGSTIKSDIYSLGILMYELITGKVPFKGDNAVEIAIKQMRDPIPSIADYRDDIPQSIENIILKATAKNPQNRYDNVNDMHDDIETALDKDRLQEEKVRFAYSEQEEQALELANLSRVEKNMSRHEVAEVKKETNVKESKTNKVLIALGTVLGILIIAVAIGFIFFNKKTPRDVKVEIPNLKNKTVAVATKELEALGFKVSVDTTKQYSDDVASGLVVNTSPKTGKVISTTVSITLIVSSGSDVIEIEDYTGLDYKDVKEKLEEKELLVVIKEEEHDATDENYKENIIISQDVAKDSRLQVGDKITLVIPKLITVYPDFVTGTYTMNDVEDFCSANGITLVKKTKEDSSVSEGSIISQSRAAGTKVYSGVTLTITTSTLPDVSSNTGTNESSTSGSTSTNG